MIFDDFGAVFRFHRVYGMLSWTIDSLQRFVELRSACHWCRQNAVSLRPSESTTYSPSGEGPFVPCCQWCIAKNGGGYTQTGVAKGLEVRTVLIYDR